MTFPSLNWEYCYTKDPYTEVVPSTFYDDFCWETNVDQYARNIVVSVIDSLRDKILKNIPCNQTIAQLII